LLVAMLIASIAFVLLIAISLCFEARRADEDEEAYSRAVVGRPPAHPPPPANAQILDATTQAQEDGQEGVLATPILRAPTAASAPSPRKRSILTH
jgi:hypothetical protein